jgi:anti-sigma factor RsiW
MTARDLRLDEDELQAFVDGHLSPERCRAAIAHLAVNADDADRLAAYRELNAELHHLFDEVLHEPLPARLRVAWHLAQPSWLARLRSRFSVDLGVWAPRFATLALLVALSGAAGWWLKGEPAPMAKAEAPAVAFARQAAHAHMLYAPDLSHPVEFWADQRESLLQWLSTRLGEPVHAPDLTSLDFELVGGRLLPSAGQPAAQLMYEDSTARRITLYLRGRWSVAESSPLSDAQEGNVQFASEGSISLVYWMEGPLAYALIGEMDRDQLFASAHVIQTELQSPELVPAAPAAEQQAAEREQT